MLFLTLAYAVAFLFGLRTSALFNGLWISIPFSIQARSVLKLQVCRYSINFGQDQVKCCFNWSQVKSNFISDIRIHSDKKYNFQLKTTTTTSVIQNELKYFPISEGNTGITEPNLEVLPLIWFSNGLVLFLFVKSLTLMYGVVTPFWSAIALLSDDSI